MPQAEFSVEKAKSARKRRLNPQKNKLRSEETAKLPRFVFGRLSSTLNSKRAIWEW